jgi:SPP1 gp7 family putative phage head morphogenesis protein
VETDEAVNGALDQLWVDSEPQAAAYLNTLVRTNMFDAFNEGRYAEFTDPALGGFVEALEYSAVLDDRTTEICQALDGSVYNADNPIWDEYRPPNHYNCRSILVAVTQLDVARGEWDGQESEPPRVQPQDGFGAGGKG